MGQTSDDVTRTIAVLRSKHNRLMRALVLETTSRLVRRTPVDTGRARGGWQVTTGAPSAQAIERLDTAGAAPIAEAVAVPIVPGGTTYIVNNVVYINELEHGSSKQAPLGMVAITAAEIQPLADQIASRG
jgi:hypothetical protein